MQLNSQNITLPNEIILNILSFLEYNDLEITGKVSSVWKVLSEILIRKAASLKTRRLAFGRNAWKLIGDSGVEPPLSRKIDEIMNRTCPFWPEKKISETHMLVLLPKTMNRKTMTFNQLNELELETKDNRNISISTTDTIKNLFGSVPIENSRWVLISKEIIPGTLNENYCVQVKKIDDIAKKTGLPYSMPSFLETVLCTVSDLVKPDESYSLFGGLEKYQFTRCKSEPLIPFDIRVGDVCNNGFLVQFFPTNASCEYTGALALMSLDKLSA